MDNKNTNHTNGIGNGFLLGLIVGVLITLLFTTKKGREILKEMTEKGLQKFSDLEDLMEKKARQEEKMEDDELEESDYIKPEPEEVKKEIRYLAKESEAEKRADAPAEVKAEPEVTKVSSNGVKKETNDPAAHALSSKRFFFRKPAKKS